MMSSLPATDRRNTLHAIWLPKAFGTARIAVIRKTGSGHPNVRRSGCPGAGDVPPPSASYRLQRLLQ